jgi:hypothetical protein
VEVVGPATEDEMILAFLRAEVQSPRFGERARHSLGHDLSLVDNPRLDDASQNLARKNALSAYRGYGKDAWLFAGFPKDAEWHHVRLTPKDLGELHYARCQPWLDMSSGTLEVCIGAANVARFAEINDNVAAIERGLASGRTFPELILAAQRPHAQHSLVEGHSRATAYYLSSHTQSPIPAIAGYSPALPTWGFL